MAPQMSNECSPTTLELNNDLRKVARGDKDSIQPLVDQFLGKSLDEAKDIMEKMSSCSHKTDPMHPLEIHNSGGAGGPRSSESVSMTIGGKHVENGTEVPPLEIRYDHDRSANSHVQSVLIGDGKSIVSTSTFDLNKRH